MDGNELLLALSAMKRGSWYQFRQFVNASDLNCRGNRPTESTEDSGDDSSVYRALRSNLQRLSHVEFFESGCERGWRVTPPVIAVHEHNGESRAILTGARADALIYQLLDCSFGANIELAAFKNCPDRILIRGIDSDVIESECKDLGFRIQRVAPESLLRALPRLSRLTFRERGAAIPFGQDWKIERLNYVSHRWEPSESIYADLTGAQLYRFSGLYETLLYAVRNRQAVLMEDQATAKYQILSANSVSVLDYRKDNNILAVPRIYRPPLLVERALLLYSGEPPGYQEGAGLLEYYHIPIEGAKMLSIILEQELVIS